MEASHPMHPAIAAERTLVTALRKAAEIYGNKAALRWKDEQGDYSQEMSLADFVAKAECLAANLAQLGLQEEEVLGIWSENDPSWSLMDVATAMNRSASVGAYLNDPIEVVSYKIRDSGAAFMFTDDPGRLAALEALETEDAPSLRGIIFLGVPPEGSKAIAFDSLVDSDAPSIDSRIDKLRANDMAKVMYTSGTTGDPKGAAITHWNLLSNAHACSKGFLIEPDFVVASYLPNAHVFQAVVDYVALLNGASLAYSSKSTLKDDLAKMRPHFLPGVPKVFGMFMQGMAAITDKISHGEANLLDDDFDSAKYADQVKKIIGLDRARYLPCGAAKLDAHVVEQYRDKVGLTIDDVYGASEMSGGVSLSGPLGRKIGRCGKPVPGIEVRIVDEYRQPLPTGQHGEIAVKGDMIFQGYLNKREATDAVLSEGWYYTGDRGMLDEEGFIQVLGRAGSRVKFTNGEYYDLEAIGDRFLRRVRLIGQVVVAGEHRDYPVALITLSEDLMAAKSFAAKQGIDVEKASDLIHHDSIVAAIKSEFEEARDKDDTKNVYERIQKAIYLRPFSPSNQEATTTQKTRLRYVLDRYEREIKNLYDGSEPFVLLEVE
jgi:long-chain acyl-CoA synthetase